MTDFLDSGYIKRDDNYFTYFVYTFNDDKELVYCEGSTSGIREAYITFPYTDTKVYISVKTPKTMIGIASQILDIN